MLPWLFVVLVLLNAGLFFWGYEREKSLEPPPTPVPEGRYEIRLIGEVPQASPQGSDTDEADLPTHVEAGEPAVGGRYGEAESVALPTAEVSDPPTGAVVGTIGGAVSEAPPEDLDQAAPEPAAADVQRDATAPAPAEVADPPVEGTNASTKQSVPNEATGQSDRVDSTASDAGPGEPVREQAPGNATEGRAGSAESPAEVPVQQSDGLRADELSLEAPTATADGAGPRMPAAPEPPTAEPVGGMPGDSSEDTRKAVPTE